MSFIRENLLKIVGFIILLIILIFVFSLIFGKKNIIVDNNTYSGMESNLLSSGKKYANDNPKLIPKKEDESNKITLDTLEKFNYIKELSAIEDENVKCTGYVELLYKNEKNIYVPYLKCGKYYETKTLANYILSNEPIVSSETGIYKIGDLYVYRGESVNNYVYVGNRLYRIIELKENGEIKLVSQEKIPLSIVWDNRYNVDVKKTVGINLYSKSRVKDVFSYLLSHNYDENNEYKNIFSEQEMEKMSAHDICVGKRSSSNTSLDSSEECQTTISDQYVSLINISDYARASIDSNCKSLYDNSCVNYNYFANIDSSFMTITAVADNSYKIYNIYFGAVSATNASASFKPNMVIYLDNLSLYNSGDGSYEKPYTIR